MARKNELTGMKYGKLTVIRLMGTNQHNKRIWLCKCDCGGETSVIGSLLKRGQTKSCGCLQSESVITKNFVHGYAHTKLYRVWRGMKERCNNKNNKSYHNYGARGIKVCDEWMNNYENFHKWSMSNGYAEGLTIDRINNDDGYSPSNCRWVSRKTQMRNVRYNKIIEIRGEKLPMAAMAEKYNVSREAIRERYKKGKRDLELIKGLKKIEG